MIMVDKKISVFQSRKYALKLAGKRIRFSKIFELKYLNGIQYIFDNNFCVNAGVFYKPKMRVFATTNYPS